MKRVRIDYWITDNHKKVKYCVTASFADEIANELIKGEAPSKVKRWLNDLAGFQGYKAAEFCMAEYAPACDDTYS